jgi:hypothetical protein
MSPPPDNHPVSARFSVGLQMTGWIACFAFLVGAMAAIAILGGNSPVALAALMGVFAIGIILLMVVFVINPLIRTPN